MNYNEIERKILYLASVEDGWYIDDDGSKYGKSLSKTCINNVKLILSSLPPLDLEQDVDLDVMGGVSIDYYDKSDNLIHLILTDDGCCHVLFDRENYYKSINNFESNIVETTNLIKGWMS